MAVYAYLLLRGLPFAVNQQGQPSAGYDPAGYASEPRVVVRQGMIFDVNAPAAAAGVLLGSSLRQARQACPNLIAAPLVDALYQQELGMFIDALSLETNRFEFDGPNALFADFAGSGEPVGILRRLAATGAGFEIIAGLGRSKLAAKAALLAAMAGLTSHKQAMFFPRPEPNIQAIEPEVSLMRGRQRGSPREAPVIRLVDLLNGGEAREREFLAGLPIGYLWPAGQEVRDRLYRLGIKRFSDLAAMAPREICRTIGPDGSRLVELAGGLDRSGIVRAYTRGEMVRRFIFDHPVVARSALKRSIAALAEDLGRALMAEGLGCRTLSLTLQRAGEGGETSATRSFSRPRGEPSALAAAAGLLWDKIPEPGELCGFELTACDIVQASGEQITFLAKAVGQDLGDSLLKTLSALERRYPGNAVRQGALPTSRRERMLELVDPMRRSGHVAPA